jgi:translation initiation factor 1 (eIF-1/SUI1)
MPAGNRRALQNERGLYELSQKDGLYEKTVGTIELGVEQKNYYYKNLSNRLDGCSCGGNITRKGEPRRIIELSGKRSGIMPEKIIQTTENLLSEIN